MTTLIRLAPLAAVLSLAGCYMDFGHGSGGIDDAPPAWGGTGGGIDPYTGGSTVAVNALTLQGDMGGVRSFSGGIYDVQAYDDGWMGEVHTYAQSTSSRWAVMSLITVQGPDGLQNDQIVPGAHFHFTNSDYSDGTHLSIQSMGCSGDEPGAWAFDQFADDVDVDVVEGASPNVVEIRYASTFTNTDYATGGSERQTVTGSFAYEHR